MPRLTALLALAALLSTSPAASQPTPCETAPAGYAGPCYYGALPAFFDDFEYTSGSTTAPAEEAGPGDLFGPNPWTLRTTSDTTRAWGRFNRGHLPVAGRIAFDSSRIRLELPAGLQPDDYTRTLVTHTGFTAREGTWHWRVRLSELWPGQKTRHAIWTMSPASYVFEPTGADGQPRQARYWSELDFENQNQFQQGWEAAMAVGNHYGKLEGGPYGRRLGRSGPVPSGEGRGALATDPSGRSHWADEWLHLVIEVDSQAETVTYRMIPEDAPEAATAFTSGPAFYPVAPMHAVLSAHWIEPERPLERPVTLEADWFYYTPVLGLSDAEVLLQVDALRAQDLSRVNTTGRPTWPERPSPHTLRIDGPERVACHEPAVWEMVTSSAGQFHSTFRYRIRHTDGSLGSWQEVYERVLTLTPRPGQAGLELEATAQDEWAPHGVIRAETGLLYPHPDNETARASRAVSFDCGG